MLAADKLQLQSAFKQQATALKEKEFTLHHSNLMTVGTQAAVLAGLDITLFVEFNPPPLSDWGPDPNMLIFARTLRVLYYAIIVAAFGANMIVVSHTTTLSVLGGGLALRGPDGSMMVATDILYAERKSVFYVFGIGLACTVGSVLICVWILLNWEAALTCWIVALWTCRTIYNNYHRASHELSYNEDETPDFTDIFEGPAAIRAIPTRLRARGLSRRITKSSSGVGSGSWYSSSGHNRRTTMSRSDSGDDGSQLTGELYDDMEMQAHHLLPEEHEILMNGGSSTISQDSNTARQRGSGGGGGGGFFSRRRSPPIQTV